MGARSSQQGLHFLLGFDDGDDFWRQAVKTGIGAIGETAQRVGNDLLGRQDGGDGLDEGRYGPHAGRCAHCAAPRGGVRLLGAARRRAHGLRSLKRSRRRLAAGISGVRLRVQAPCSLGESARPRLMNQEASWYRPRRL